MTIKMCIRRILYSMGFLLTFLSLVGVTYLPAGAQGPQPQTSGNWAPVAPMPNSFDDALPPVMAVDENKTVHAFVTMPLSLDPADSLYIERAIYYRRWTLEGGWTKPVDIILSPLARQARVKAVTLDKAGVLHLLFFGGDDNAANIYYSSAPASEAYSAQAWSDPLLIGPSAITPDVAGLAGNGENQLVALYSGNLGEGNSLYVVYSDDSGASWSEPQLLYSTFSLDSQVFFLHYFYGESGTLHVVWNTVNKKGENVDGFYSQLADPESRRWSEPLVIDKSVELGFAAPAVIEYNGNIMIIYNNGVEGQVAPVSWFVNSADGGKTFTKPIQPFPDHIGRNGTSSFVVDSNNRLHLFWGQRIPGGVDGTIDLHGMWHSIWDSQSWGPVRPVESGPRSESFDPYDANAVSVQGNVLLLTYRTDPGREISNSWWTTTVLDDAPELPVKPLPTPPLSVIHGQTPLDSAFAALSQSNVEAEDDDAAATGTSAADLGLEVSLTPSPQPEFSKEVEEDAGSPGTPLLFALVPTALFIAGALIFGNMRHQRQ